VAAREARELTPHEDETLYVPGPWARDGSGFYVLTDEGREFAGLAFFRLASEQVEWIETPEADVEEVAASRDGRFLAWLVNDGGWSRLESRDLQTGEALPAARLPAGTRSPSGSGLTLSDGGRAALVWHEPRRPGELYVVELPTGKVK